MGYQYPGCLKPGPSAPYIPLQTGDPVLVSLGQNLLFLACLWTICTWAAIY